MGTHDIDTVTMLHVYGRDTALTLGDYPIIPDPVSHNNLVYSKRPCILLWETHSACMRVLCDRIARRILVYLLLHLTFQPARSKEKQLMNYSPHPAVHKQFLVQLQILQPKDLFVSQDCH